MPNRVGQFNIWERLRSRFRLEPILPLVLKTLGDEIIPVTNVDDLLLSPTSQTASLNLTATAGSYVSAFTVPAGERWHLRWAWHLVSVAATQMGFVNAAVNIRISTNEIAEQSVNLGDALVLEEGDTMGMFTSGDAGDTSITFRIHYSVEDVSG